MHSLPDATTFIKDDPNYIASTGPQPAKLIKDREALKKSRQLGHVLARVETEAATTEKS